MDAPKIPTDEAARIEALYSADILDTDNEPMFDNLTALVADIFDVPIVAMSLVDKSRQWFKSIQGLDVCETSREVSFCGHAVYQESPMVVNDAREDKRFFDNPLVANGPKIVFYVGVPITYKHHGEDFYIGTLCLIDYKPRSFDDKSMERLKGFALEVELLLAMRMTTEKAEAANEAKSRFLANMTHELRTPMSGVISILDILDRSNLSEEQAYQLGLARQSSSQMLSVINDILDFSKIEAGKVSIKYENFNLYELFESLIETFRLRAQNQHKTFTLDTNWDKDTYVKGDPTRLRQILLNLLNNADKFTLRGEVTLSAELELLDAEHLQLRCNVTDTGIGIEQSQLSRLFVPFEQLDNRSARKYGGTGLGLVITRHLCELMGGEISVESKLGKGSSFIFDIKLIAVTQTGSEQQQYSALDLEHKIALLSKLKILVVEDDLTNRIALEYFLQHLNISFQSASNGLDAIKRLKHTDAEAQYDLILMDCQMPEMDGFGATQYIRQQPAMACYRQTPIIALTANALEGDREKCLQAGMTDYMTKPVELNVLIEKLYHWGINSKTQMSVSASL